MNAEKENIEPQEPFDFGAVQSGERVDARPGLYRHQDFPVTIGEALGVHHAKTNQAEPGDENTAGPLSHTVPLRVGFARRRRKTRVGNVLARGRFTDRLVNS